jgi:peptidoglycan/xylan/chitin deacetylase (PgdA/CDA1 family)
VVNAAPTYTGFLFCRGPVWQQRAKDRVKRFVPASVTAARRAWLERTAANGSPSGAPADLIRRTAAVCYFHLGGPAASRVVRARYQASVSEDGRLLRGSWTKRREPTGRILYYHRVNDDADRFFPSTPLDVFERQMRHVAQNYKVVSLRGLLDHLAGGSAESVVAITFDDGYRDNYEKAFPILRRYRLPATIFLTTGSLDSREPLWFEVLAGALKTTSKEFLDLEADIPRRFWLRTVDERLHANGELFALLRRMPDGDRQQHLSLILRDLASADCAQRMNMMLTWDQVRQMKEHGIDFGGHTVTHPYLSRLTEDQVKWEVSESKRRIESELQAPVSHFAYPNGREEDFAPWSKDVIRNAGYEAAVTTLWGLNYRTTDRLELRRGGAWEQDAALFAYKMDWYQLVNG